MSKQLFYLSSAQLDDMRHIWIRPEDIDKKLDWNFHIDMEPWEEQIRRFDICGDKHKIVISDEVANVDEVINVDMEGFESLINGGQNGYKDGKQAQRRV